MIEERDVQATLDANVDAGLMERTADGHYRLTRKGEHHVEAMPNGGIWFFSALTELLREYERRLAAALRADDLPAIDGAALHVLLALYRTDMQRAADLALATGWAATAFTPVLDRLERTGLVARYEHPTDRRSVLIGLTDRSEGMRRSLVNVGQALNNTLWAKLQDLI